MDIFLDPNIIYLLLLGGMVLAIVALFSPGTGIIEIGALFMLAMAGYGIYNTPTNGWALGLLLAGGAAFVFAFRLAKPWILLGISAFGLVLGSMFVFQSPDGQPAIHPLLAVVASAAAFGFLWIAGRKSLSALSKRPALSLDELTGMEGEARTDIDLEGSAYINSEEWTARSATHIPAGSRVRVTGRQGLVLIVEPVEDERGKTKK